MVEDKLSSNNSTTDDSNKTQGMAMSTTLPYLLKINHNRNSPLRKTAQAVNSDNQAGSPPTYATATGALAACWRGHSGTRAVVMRLSALSLQRNY